MVYQSVDNLCARIVHLDLRVPRSYGWCRSIFFSLCSVIIKL